MEHSKKEYLQAKLNLSIAIVSEHFSAWKVSLDKKIERATYLLNCHGFSTTMSCEGHVSPYKEVDTFRLFWPYVQIELIHNVKFHLEEKRARMETIAGSAVRNLSKLKELIDEFNHRHHPFSEKHLEMSTLMIRGIDSVISPLDVHDALQNHFGLQALVCDVGVHGVLTMPQEFLNDDFRKRFLERTQHQMDLFTKFLEWRYLHPHDEEEKI